MSINYLESEYQFASQSAEMASKWSDYEKDGDQYNLQYRTANDDRVRYEHQALHNVTLPPSDPFWSKYFPPNGWRCRCNTVQVRKESYPETDSATANMQGEQATYTVGKGRVNTSAMFRFNAGKQKIIFPKTHPYFKSLKTSELEVIQGMAKKAQPTNDFVVKTYKSGGEIQTPKGFKQNTVEQDKNVKAYTYLAKNHGDKYRLLNVTNEHGIKNPDALNLKTNKFSDTKIPTTKNGKNAIQNSIRAASKQKVPEVYIYLENEFPMIDIWQGMKAGLQNGRAKTIETILIKRGGEVKRYDVEKLRKTFKGGK